MLGGRWLPVPDDEHVLGGPSIRSRPRSAEWLREPVCPGPPGARGAVHVSPVALPGGSAVSRTRRQLDRQRHGLGRQVASTESRRSPSRCVGVRTARARSVREDDGPMYSVGAHLVAPQQLSTLTSATETPNPQGQPRICADCSAADVAIEAETCTSAVVGSIPRMPANIQAV